MCANCCVTDLCSLFGPLFGGFCCFNCHALFWSLERKENEEGREGILPSFPPFCLLTTLHSNTDTYKHVQHNTTHTNTIQHNTLHCYEAIRDIDTKIVLSSTHKTHENNYGCKYTHYLHTLSTHSAHTLGIMMITR